MVIELLVGNRIQASENDDQVNCLVALDRTRLDVCVLMASRVLCGACAIGGPVAMSPTATTQGCP